MSNRRPQASVRGARPRHMDRRGEVSGGLAAMVGLLALVIGLPIVLWAAVGWPLPTSLPSLGDLQMALARDALPDDVLVKAVACVAWLAWAQFVACVAVELVAAVRGRVPARVPFAGPNQVLARRLVAAALLVTWSAAGMARPASAATGAEAAPSGRPAATADRSSGPIVADPSALAVDPGARPAKDTVGASVAAEAGEEQLYVVRPRGPGRPRDTFWRIAEEHLGDPMRWRELWELNKGRELPDGRTLEDPDWIYPGCVLKMPADAVGLPETRKARPAPDPVPELVAEPDAPAAGTLAASDELAELATTLPRTLAADRFGITPAAARTTLSEQPIAVEPLTVPVLAAGGLLSAGVAAALASLRGSQRRRRPAGRRVPAPPPALAEVELALRAAQEPETARYLDLALRALAAGLRAERRTLPDVLGVELTTARIDVLLAEPGMPPAGWSRAGSDERRWRLPGGVPVAALAAAADGIEPPLPELVTVGATEAGVLMVNLAQPGLTMLSGGPLVVRRAVETLAVELATSVWAGHFELVLAGFGDTGLTVLDHVTAVRHTGDLLSALRWRDDPDVPRWRRPPTLVLCALPPGPEELAALTGAAKRGLVAVVAPGEPTGYGWAIGVEEDRLDIGPLNLRVRPALLGADQTDAVGQLLRIAAGDTSDPLEGPPPWVVRAAEEEQEGLEDDPVEVRILGPVELDGVPLPRSEPGTERARELVVYLAMHPEGVDPERLWGALWPGRSFEPEILHAVAGLAREAMGLASDGKAWLDRDRSGRYRLHHGVRLDWSRFWVLAAHAQPGPEGVPVLRAALNLVTGRPFSGVPARGFGWAEVGHRALIEGTVVDVAEDLARRCLAAGDSAGAAWAARQGLAVSPADERLYRLVMLAADVDQDPAGVDAAMDELQHRLAAEQLPSDDELQVETLALYEQLGRSLRPLGSAAR